MTQFRVLWVFDEWHRNIKDLLQMLEKVGVVDPHKLCESLEDACHLLLVGVDHTHQLGEGELTVLRVAHKHLYELHAVSQGFDGSVTNFVGGVLQTHQYTSENGLDLLCGDAAVGTRLLHQLAQRSERHDSRERDVRILMFGVAGEDVDNLRPSPLR